MVHRNRACPPCRKRRIKCDETIPSCRQCLRAGRICPGPLQGAIIVYMPGSTASNRGSMSKSTHDPPLAIPVRLPSPPDHNVMKQTFVARFLDYFCGSLTGQRDRSWMLLLPYVLCRAPALKAVVLPLEAVALAHFANEAACPDAIIKSGEIYAEALGSHRVFVRQVVDNEHPHMLQAFELVASNMMLAFFEAIQCTTYEAYGAHISAAAGFLEGIGAESCRAGVMNQLFFSVRAQTTFLSFTMNAPIRFASQEWHSVPQSGQPSKSTCESVIDIIISISGLSAICHENSCFGQAKRKIPTLHLRYALESLWTEYSRGGGAEERAALSQDESHGRTYRDALTAMTIAYFACATLILRAWDPDAGVWSSQDQVFVDPYAAILSCVTYLEAKVIGCAYIRMVLPLVLVAQKSPRPAQRYFARDQLRRWVSQKKMAGLCKTALQYIEEHDLKESNNLEYSYDIKHVQRS